MFVKFLNCSMVEVVIVIKFTFIAIIVIKDLENFDFDVVS